MVPRSLLLAPLLLASLAGCVTDDFDPVDAPAWQTGDAFAYEAVFEVRADVVEKEDGRIVSETHDAVSRGDPEPYFFEVLDTDLLVDEQPAYLAGLVLPVQSPIVQPLAIAREDLAALPSSRVEETQCVNSRCQGRVASYFQADAERHPYLLFPLEAGKQWSTDDVADLPIRTVSRVAGMETIETAAGRMDAVRVDHSIRLIDRDALVREGREALEAQGIRVDTLELELRADIVTWYNHALTAIVKEEFHAYEKARFKGHFEGTDFDSQGESRTDLVATLTGLRDVARPERSPGNIASVWVGQDLLLDPAGEPVVPTPSYPFRLHADAPEVNAAEAPTVAFTIDLGGLPLPDGHTLTSTVRDPEGTVVGRGNGTTFSQVFDDPGVYLVQAVARDAEGRARAVEHLAIIADWTASVPAACSLASVLDIPGCDPASLPVRRGVQTLDVRLDLGGLLAPVSLGTLELSDPDGRTATTGGDRITVIAFDGASVDGRDWRTEWRPLLEVLEDASYQITLDYGDPAGSRMDVTASIGSTTLPGPDLSAPLWRLHDTLPLAAPVPSDMAAPGDLFQRIMTDAMQARA